MRILLCIEHWELIGGSERYAGVLARALAERGHHLGVLCARASEASGAMGRADIARFVLPHIGAGTRVIVRTEDASYVERAKD